MSFYCFIEPTATKQGIQNLKITPTWYKSSIVGGPIGAEADVEGDIVTLWTLVDFLSRNIKIYNDRNENVWHGQINEVRINHNGITFCFSLKNVFNKIAVAYTIVQANGTQLRKTTAYSTNTTSATLFGIRELLYSLGESTDEAAAAKVTELLSNYAMPQAVPSFGGRQGVYATLICTGYFESLSLKHFSRPEGRIEFNDTSASTNISQAIGWGHTSQLISFRGLNRSYSKIVTGATNATPIVVTTSTNHAMKSGDIVTISGVGGNTAANGTFKIKNVTSTTFELTNQTDDSDIAGNGAYTSGGTVTKTFAYVGASKIYYGKKITDATNASPIVITCNSHGFANNDIVTISDVEGNTAANGTYKVASATTNTFAIVDTTFGTNTTGNGDYATGGIVSKESDVGPFKNFYKGQKVIVTGSASNNNTYILFENASNNGKTINTLQSLTNEDAGASVTLSLVGYRSAQSFVQSHAFEFFKVGVKVAKVGNPADSLKVDIQTDSAGSPSGTVVASSTIQASDLTTSNQWVWATAASHPSLTNGATYWVVVYRSSTLDSTNYYLLQLETTSSGSSKSFDGSSWVTQPNGQFIPNKIWGWEDTVTQVKRIITDCGQFGIVNNNVASNMNTILTSGTKTNQWRGGDLTAYDEILKLLSLGTSTGLRLTISVEADLTTLISHEKDVSQVLSILDDGNIIREQSNDFRAKGVLPIGEWLILNSVPEYIASMYGITPIFIDEAEYSVKNDKLSLKPKVIKL